MPPLIGDAGIVRRLLANEAEIVEISMESRYGADGNDTIKTPESFAGKRFSANAAVVEDATLTTRKGSRLIASLLTLSRTNWILGE